MAVYDDAYGRTTGVSRSHTFDNPKPRPEKKSDSDAFMDKLVGNVQVREQGHIDVTFDTATSLREEIIDVHRLFDGAASSMSVNSIGGGTLQVSMNGGRFQTVNLGDRFDNETITRVIVRAVTGAAGTAVLRFGANLRG